MLEVNFEPKTEGFSGHMVVAIPSYLEKMKLMKEVGITINKDGQVDMKAMEKMDTLEKVELCLNKVRPFLRSVADLKFQDKPVKSVEHLEHYEEGLPVLVEVFHFVMEGLSLGKS